MLRRGIRIFAVCLILLGALALVLWPVTMAYEVTLFRWDTGAGYQQIGSNWRVYSMGGAIVLEETRFEQSAQWFGAWPDLQRHGFGMQTRPGLIITAWVPAPATSYREIWAPHWFAAALFALPGIVLLRLARRRVRPGFCTQCGYDLRATPDRCPDCGRPVVETAGAK